MKKNRLLCLFLFIMVILSGLRMPAAAQQDNLAVTQGCHSVDAALTLSSEEKLVETAKAVVLYELNSGTMLYALNPDGKIYPTSMVKLMTALVALEQGNLDDVVTVTRSVLNQVPIGVLGADLKAGEEITLRDLLYANMVASATDAAVIAAAYVGGSVDGFLQMMNDKAAELGCTATNYSNVHGLHDENTYTTARDIARITEAALKNEAFRDMFCAAEYTLAATNKHEARTITTTNHMMNPKNSKYYDKRVTGGKTGATDQGGRCLTLTAEQEGMEILCVLMGATPTVAANGSLSAYGSFEESRILVDYAFQSFEYRQVFFSGQSLAQYPVSDGANDVVTQAVDTISTVLPKEVEEAQLKWVYKPTESVMTAPVAQGQKLGTVEAWYGNKCLAQADMVAMNAVEQKQSPIVPKKPASGTDDGSWLVLFLVLAGGALAVFLGLIGLRAFRIWKLQRRRKRRRSRRR